MLREQQIPSGAPSGAPLGARTRVFESPWAVFVGHRLLGFAISAALLIFVTFLIVPFIPGDPAVSIAGVDASREQIETIREQLGLNNPLWVQFGSYVAGLATFDLGTSFVYARPVVEIIASALPYTLALSGLAIIIVLVVSISLGLTVGVLTRGGRRSVLDVVFSTVTGIVSATPQYVMATVLVVVFAITFRLLPAAGAASPLSFVLPLTALSIGPVCSISRLVRAQTSAVLSADYMRTARGKRLPAVRLYLRHALPNLLTATLTMTGILLVGMLGGAVIIENVFNWPGLGSEVVEAIIKKDYPVIQGSILVLGMLAIVVNAVVDVVLGIVDPRVLGREGGGE